MTRKKIRLGNTSEQVNQLLRRCRKRRLTATDVQAIVGGFLSLHYVLSQGLGPIPKKWFPAMAPYFTERKRRRS